MCSISGITWKDPAIVQGLNLSQQNRGPDGSGVVTGSNFTLGHTLLAINSDKGQQPLRGLGDLTFNGQIYDCPWEKGLDSKWLLENLDKKGYSFLEDVNGMWAFAYVRDNLLYLIRDHFGAKPLYYSEVPKGLIFSSTIPALLGSGLVSKEFSDSNIYVLENGNYWQSGEITPYKNIKKVPPGGVYIYSIKEKKFIEKRNLWENFRLSEPQDYNHFDFRSKVLTAIKNTSNTRKDLGVLLSGGLDSTLIASVLHKCDIDFTAYTTTYEKPDNMALDKHLLKELEYAKHTCDVYGIKHKISTFPFNNNYWTKKTLAVSGTVLEDNYRMMPRLFQFSEVAKDTTKVVLSGDGGDEIFTGYNLHKKWIKEGFPEPRDVHRFIEMQKIETWFPMECIRGVDAATAQMFLNLLTQCETYLLRFDAFTGEYGLEGRAPLLYQDLVKYAMRLELGVKLKHFDPEYAGINKYLIREVFADVIPDKIRYRSVKIGWSVPWNRNKQKERKVADRELLKTLI